MGGRRCLRRGKQPSQGDSGCSSTSRLRFRLPWLGKFRSRMGQRSGGGTDLNVEWRGNHEESPVGRAVTVRERAPITDRACGESIRRGSSDHRLSGALFTGIGMPVPLLRSHGSVIWRFFMITSPFEVSVGTARRAFPGAETCNVQTFRRFFEVSA